jgi:hypothetical protein
MSPDMMSCLLYFNKMCLVYVHSATTVKKYRAPFWLRAFSLPMENHAVLRILDVYPGSRIRIFSIPDPGSSSKKLSILTKTWFLSSRKYFTHPGSRIQGSKRHRFRIRNTGEMFTQKMIPVLFAALHLKKVCDPDYVE